MTITIDDADKPYKADANAKTATVSVLNKKKILLAVYGAGPTGANDTANGLFFEPLVRKIEEDYGYEVMLYPESRGDDQLAEFFTKMNADSSKDISRAEAEAVELALLGYSRGGINAHNFAIKLARVDKRIEGYRLKHEIAVKQLVTIDAVEAGGKRLIGDFGSNVLSADNYYQGNFGNRSVVALGAMVNGVFQPDGRTSVWTGIQNLFVGEAINGATNMRVDTQMGGTEVIRRYPRESDEDFGRLLGKEVNHGSIVWYVFDLVAPKFA